MLKERDSMLGRSNDAAIYIILFFFFIGCTTLIGQQEVRGKVINEDGLGLVGANVLLMDSSGADLIDFAITGGEGEFVINLREDYSHILKCNYLGYEEFAEKVSSSKSEMQIVLLKAAIGLEEIEVKDYKRGLIINGDTTVFDPSTFTSGSENDLKEVLKKLPGIEVNDDNSITYQGREIDKILLEGDDFLNANRADIMGGIVPADIGSIRVFESKNNSSSDDDELNLDVKFKSGSLNKWKGKINVGGGIENVYDAGLKAYSVSEKMKVFTRLESSNDGQKILSIGDYIGLIGLDNLRSGHLSIPDIFREDHVAQQINQNYVSSRLSWKSEQGSSLRASIYGYTSKQKRDEEELVFRNNTEFSSNTEQTSEELITIGSLTNFKHDFGADNGLLEFQQNLSFSETNNNFSGLQNLSEGETFALGRQKFEDFFTWVPSLSYSFLLGKHQTLKALGKLEVIRARDHMNIDQSQSRVYVLDKSAELVVQDIEQTRRRVAQSQELQIEYLRRIKKWTLFAQTGFINQKMTWRISNNISTVPETESSFQFMDNSLGFKYANSGLSVNFSGGLRTVNGGLLEKRTYERFNFQAQYKLLNKASIYLNAEKGVGAYEYEQAPGTFGFQDETSVFREALEGTELVTSSSYFLLFFAPLGNIGLLAHTSLGYRESRDLIARNTDFFDDHNVFISDQFGNQESRFINLGLSKVFYRLQCQFKAKIAWRSNESLQSVEEVISNLNSKTHRLQSELISQYRGMINYEIKWNQEKFIFGAGGADFISGDLSIALPLNWNDSKFRIRPELEYQYANLSDFQRVNINLGLRQVLSEKFSLKLEGRDIFNLSSRGIVDVVENEFFRREYRRLQIPGYLMLSVEYSF